MVDSAYDELLGKLDALPTRIRKAALTKALRAMGEVMQEAIVAAAPMQVDDVHGVLPAGALKEDIKVRVHVADDEAVTAGDTDSVTIGPTRKTVDIAIDVETGHANRARTVPRNKARIERTEDHPFVRPAFDATKDQAIAVFEETMVARIQKAMNA